MPLAHKEANVCAALICHLFSYMMNVRDDAVASREALIALGLGQGV